MYINFNSYFSLEYMFKSIIEQNYCLFCPSLLKNTNYWENSLLKKKLRQSNTLEKMLILEFSLAYFLFIKQISFITPKEIIPKKKSNKTSNLPCSNVVNPSIQFLRQCFLPSSLCSCYLLFLLHEMFFPQVYAWLITFVSITFFFMDYAFILSPS